MLLKYNTANIKHERRLLDIKTFSVTMQGNGESAIVFFETNIPHKLNVGDYVFLTPMYDDEKTKINDVFKVLPGNFSTTSFSIEITRFKPIYIKGINDGTTISIIKTAYDIPFPVIKGTPFVLLRRYWTYKEVFIEDDSLITYKVVSSKPINYIGSDYIKNEYTNQLYQWQIGYENINCTHINNRCFEAPIGEVLFNEEYLIEDEQFITHDGILRDDMNVYEYLEMINVSLPLSNTFSTELQDEEVAQALFKEKKDELIPDIVDYEKRCFSPYYKYTVSSMAPVDTLVFNLYFRDRSGNTNWTTKDHMGWNQCKMNDLEFSPNEVLTNGDLLSYLNFTDEDVYYRKKKISKSFLRLSFYDSMDPMKQMLIYYSTIFLDTGELYNKYIKNHTKKITESRYDPLYTLVNDESLGEDSLTVSFKVSNRYNKQASSEGFYLYLFPDGLENDNERTIYMKAEFNHAGYGTTIPLIIPNNGSALYDFNNKDFPLSLINEEDGNLSEYYRQLYIPVKIRYDRTSNDFIYYVPLAKRQEDTLTFNLYEPRINPIEGEKMVIHTKPSTKYSLFINPSACTININSSTQLTATFYTNGNGANVTNLVTWSSSNSKATINSKGLVTGKSEGTVTITASYNGYIEECKVKVVKTDDNEGNNYNIYADKRTGEILSNSDIKQLPCDITIKVEWICNIYWDDNYDGDDDRQEQYSGTNNQTFKAGATNLLRIANATGGNNFNSWVGDVEVVGPTSYAFTYNNNNYQITWK